MEDFRYKEYTEEESRIYYDAMGKIMEGLTNGMSFNQACSAVLVQDEQLRAFIEDDALKIVIADLHYNKGISIEKVAENLQLQIEVLRRANAEMLEDIEATSIEIYKAQNPGSQAGNA